MMAVAGERPPSTATHAFVPAGKSTGSVGTNALPSNTTGIVIPSPSIPILALFPAIRYGVSTVTAITMGAVRSGPFTRSIVFTTASGRLGSIDR